MATGTILLTVPGNFDTTAPPGLGFFNSKPRMLFDDTTDEFCHWTFRMPQDYASALVLKVQYSMASATSGNVVISCDVMAVSDGDAAAVDSDSYDTTNASSTITVPATAGYIDEISLSLSNADSVAAGDFVAIRFFRDGSADSATGDMELIAASIEYTTS